MIGERQVDGYTALTLESPGGEIEASLVPEAGMIGCSLRHRGKELLGQRRGLGACVSERSTMGVPLLYPWANRLARRRFQVGGREVNLDAHPELLSLGPNGLPTHGLLAGETAWRVERHEATADGAVLAAAFDFGARTELIEAFPFPHTLRVEAALAGTALTVETTVTAADDAVRFAKDYVGVDYHNDSHSHIDALCHVAFDGSLYNGRPSGSVTSQGAGVETIEVGRDGLVGRGVLLDIPRVRGVDWLEPGEHVFPSDLEGAERTQDVTVTEGDILLVRTGHARRLAELDSWDTPHAKAGLHPSCARFLAERKVTALGADGNSDTAPSTTEGIDFPIHALALNAMGIHLLDYLQFEDLVAGCEREGRWEFLFAAAPLRVVGGTGSPLNPIAIL